MAIVETIAVSPSLAKGSVITAANFGINLVLGYERFGGQPWEKFDEIQSAVGSQDVRFPGGVESELLFDYANPDATVTIAPDGSVRQLIAPDAFLDYCAASGSRATFNLPVMQLLNGARYGARDFDAAKEDEVRAYVAHLLEKAGPQGIATFELGNEYEAYMTSAEYGRVSSHLARIVDQEIDRYYAAHPADAGFRPDVAVQVWGQSQGGTYSLSDLSNRNLIVMAEFSAEELAAVTAVTSHFYYDEGDNLGKPNYHIYSNIAASVGYSLAMMADWNTATGRSLDTVFSEWNVNLNDRANYGLQQIPVLLEMFSTFVAGGVDQMDFWSTMYHATSLANYRGELQAAGTLFQVMSHDLIGMRATDVPVASDKFDIHAFAGHGQAVLFVSSLGDGALSLDLDLSRYLSHYTLASARLMQVDLSRADGSFKGLSGLQPWEEPDAPILLTLQSIADRLKLGHYLAELGAHETLVLVFDQAPTILGSPRPDRLHGAATNDRIDGLASADVLRGGAGDDSLFGGSGDDTLLGGDGHDRIWGGDGADMIRGHSGNDTLEGKMGCDLIQGGGGRDYLVGGNNSDTLFGGAGADAFVFRAGDFGTDLIGDFSRREHDFLVFDGAPVTAGDFRVEIRSVPGMGSDAADLLVHWGAKDQVIWALQDAGGLSHLSVLDAGTGALLTLL